MKSNRLFPVLPLVLVFAFFLITNAKSVGQSSSIVVPGATPQAVNVDLGGGGSEGPAVDADGNVYFTTAQMGTGRKSGTIQKWTWADGKVVKYRDVDGAAIGAAFDAKGRLLVGEWDNNRITADDLNGHITVLVDSIDGRKILTPNTIVVDRKGGVYFTEWPGFKMMGAMPAGGPGGGAPSGAMPAGGPSGGIPGSAGGPKIESIDSEYAGIDYISPDGKKVTQVAKIKGSHKVVLSPDGKTLIASGSSNKLWKFAVNGDGTLSNQEEFCKQQCDNLSIDGMTFDENSNLYMAGDKVYVFNLKGEKLAAFDLPRNASNLRFAGKDRKTLFITGHGGVYTLEMAVRGAPTALDMAIGQK
jgi:gluconolactonase